MKRTPALVRSMEREAELRALALRLASHGSRRDETALQADTDQLTARAREVLEGFGIDLESPTEILVGVAITSAIISLTTAHQLEAGPCPDGELQLGAISAAVSSIRQVCIDRVRAGG